MKYLTTIVEQNGMIGERRADKLFFEAESRSK